MESTLTVRLDLGHLVAADFDWIDFVRIRSATKTALFQPGLQCILCLQVISG